MKKLSFLKCFVETLPSASESLVKTLRATSLLGMMVLAPLGATAQVTIGSDALPQATLDIIGDTLTAHGEAFRLIDGNQGVGKILTCQENGIGTWKTNSVIVGRGVFPDTGLSDSLYMDYRDYRYTGVYIDLPPGLWYVNENFYCMHTATDSIKYQNYGFLLRFAFDDVLETGIKTREGTWSPDVQTAGPVASPGLAFVTSQTVMLCNATFGFCFNGSMFINNTSHNTKRYYGYVSTGLYRLNVTLPGTLTVLRNTKTPIRWDRAFASTWSENAIIAIAADATAIEHKTP